MNPLEQTPPGQPETTTGPGAEPCPVPERIGRYPIVRLLGRGGFGCVYLAQDEVLERYVAIKVPHRRLITRYEDAEPYLAEARIVAKLDDHPNIVRVLDVGSTDDFPCFVVSKFIDGSTLGQKIAEESF